MAIAPSKSKKALARERELRKVLADNLRDLRRSRGFSQEALAAKCGLHRTYVGSVERGERNVSLSSLVVLAGAFDVAVAELLTRGAQSND